MRFMVMVKATPESERFSRSTAAARDGASTTKSSARLVSCSPWTDSTRAPKAHVSNSPSGKSRTVIDGPFTEAKELIAGFSILQVKSLAEAIKRVKRGPNCNPGGDYEVEIRQIFEMEEFAPILSEEQIQHKVAKRAHLPDQTANK